MACIYKEKMASKGNFEAYSQAQKIQEQVNAANGISKNKQKPSDILKSTLCVALNLTLGKQ